MNNTIRRIINSLNYITDALATEFYWFKRSVKYSMFYRDEEYLSNRLLVLGHTVEKGITMPNRRLGFGIGSVRLLITLCNEYIIKYGKQSPQLMIAISALREYLQIHIDARYELYNDIVVGIQKLLSGINMEEIDCTTLTKEIFFSPCSDFETFANQRHTCRYYSSVEISNEIIMKVIELANTAPSACNRQSVRVICLSGDVKDNVLALQNGNRGFGQSINKLLLVTFRQPSWEYDIQSAGYFDAGIYTMNLLYALHYYKICACTLNCHLKPKNLEKIRNLLEIPSCEVPTAFIGIGYPTDKIMIAKSERIPANKIITFK